MPDVKASRRREASARTCTVPTYTHQRGTFIPIGRCNRPAHHTFGPPLTGNCCNHHAQLLDGLYPLHPAGDHQ